MNEVLEKVAQPQEALDNKAYKSELLTLLITLSYSSDSEELNRKRVDLNKNSVLETVVKTIVKNLNLNYNELKRETFSERTYIKIANELYSKNAEENSQESYINNLVCGFSTLMALDNKIAVDRNNAIFCQYVFASGYNPTAEENDLPEKCLDRIAAHRKLNKIIALNNL